MSLNIESSAVKRIQHLRTQQGNDALMLRIAIEGGGCSGFQYKMELTEEVNEDDTIFHDAILIDEVSLPLMQDSTISFEEALIGAQFKIENPKAVSGCGCGVSFSL